MLRCYSGPIGQHSFLAQLPVFIIFCDYVGTIELGICLSGGLPSPSSFFSEKSKDVHVFLANDYWITTTEIFDLCFP